MKIDEEREQSVCPLLIPFFLSLSVIDIRTLMEQKRQFDVLNANKNERETDTQQFFFLIELILPMKMNELLMGGWVGFYGD